MKSYSNKTICLVFSLLLSAGLSLSQSNQLLADASETATNSSSLAVQGSISTGNHLGCAVLAIGSLKCWGDNYKGQVGDGTTTIRRTPTQVSGLNMGVSAVSAGSEHTCAIVNSDGLKCWGRNDFGQLGDNSTVDRLIPTQVWGLSSGVKTVAAGGYHTCVLRTAGSVLCWGLNTFGALGNNSTTANSIPQQVDGLTSGVIAITTGAYSTCALLDTGSVKCWGRNIIYGTLGDNTLTNRLVPTQVSGLSSGVVAISGGEYHTCALLSTGSMRCWGYNYFGQVGNGDTVDQLTPVQVSGLTSDVTAISAGTYHSCALLASGAAKCWGINSHGGLGDNSLTNRLVPTSVYGLSSGVVAISAGFYHTCAILDTGSVKCWGLNNGGGVGDNTLTHRSIPTSVVGLGDGTAPTTTTTTLPPTTTTTSTTTVAPVSSTTTQAPTTTVVTPTSTVTPAPTTTSPPVNNEAATTPASPTTTAPASIRNSPTTSPSSSSTSSTTTSTSSTTTTTTTTIPLTAEISKGNTTAIATALKKNSAAETSVYINGKKTKATVTRTATNIIVTVAGTNTRLSATAPDGTSINITSDGVLEVKHGSLVSTATSGFAPYSSVESWCYSTPTKLGTEKTNGVGETQARYEITTQIPSGQHHLVVRGTSSKNHTVTIGFAMRVAEESLMSKLATSPIVWVILLLALLLAIFIPSRLRHNDTQ